MDATVAEVDCIEVLHMVLWDTAELLVQAPDGLTLPEQRAQLQCLHPGHHILQSC